MDDLDEASTATGWAVSAFNCVLAKVWDKCAGSEFGFLYTGDKDVLLDEDIVYLLTRVLNVICIEMEKWSWICLTGPLGGEAVKMY